MRVALASHPAPQGASPLRLALRMLIAISVKVSAPVPSESRVVECDEAVLRIMLRVLRPHRPLLIEVLFYWILQ